MEIELDLGKSAQENANDYFLRAKKARKKAAGARAALEALAKQLKEAEKPKLIPDTKIRRIRNGAWFESFHWFFTSNGMLAIGGKSAQQNEIINSRYFGDSDVFFHADVFGAPVVILKNGINANAGVKEEVAQFAACYSRAWEYGLSAVNVYSALRGQVSKSKAKGSLPTGSFLITGEREWYKGMKLELCVFVGDRRSDATNSVVAFVPQTQIVAEVDALNVVPSSTMSKLNISRYIILRPGRTKKSDAAKMIAKALGFNDIDYVMRQLPAGSFDISSNF
ncbi:MAG: NFACT RNA binding domain-containing protein [Candidatus Micrarchaeaceae archaeon]